MKNHYFLCVNDNTSFKLKLLLNSFSYKKIQYTIRKRKALRKGGYC